MAVRKRIPQLPPPVTLYSEEHRSKEDGVDSGDLSAADELSPPSKKQQDSKESESEVRKVAEDMFSDMCKGLNKETISEGDVDGCVLNLADTRFDPTKSLMTTLDYAQTSEGIKALVRKLLLTSLHNGDAKEVC